MSGEEGGVEMLNMKLNEPLPGFIPRKGGNNPQVTDRVIDEEMALFRKAQA